MKFLFDLFPVILFFLVYKLGEGHQEAAHAFASQYLGSLVSGGQLTATQSPIMLATAVGIALVDQDRCPTSDVDFSWRAAWCDHSGVMQAKSIMMGGAGVLGSGYFSGKRVA